MKAVEIEYWKRSCHLTTLYTVTNDEIRRRVEVGVDIIKCIETKQLKRFIHLNRTSEARYEENLEMGSDKKKKG